ncbi:sensor histidine kinase [Metasolibacillus meyeri]|uniref:Signal transduction histidine-protein kinase/phosphatase DegS n=1 Tax=Metasolibacillus meyeri TaxID=1071052 RepID=A0AAW9NW75_9BACL|nr:sensor histidine kinase [Metasolibacillus meyeri]MEC1180852.1 sensor histidine kinase [Metasolibacillus meyeri]
MFLNEKFDIASLDVIFNRMLETIMSSKNDIFIISEQSQRNFEEMQKELAAIRDEIAIVIDEADYLEKTTQHAKQRLVVVSKAFNTFTEEQVREAYETANNFQIKYLLVQEKEKQLRERRDDLERRMKILYDTIKRADQIVNQVNVVVNYLTSDLKDVGQALEQAKIKQDFGIKILSAQEEERKRLSREIHDGPAQMMANVLMRSDLIERIYRDKGMDAAIKEIAHLKLNVREALSEVRRIIYDLRPMALDDLGILPTLKKYLSTIMEYNEGVHIHFQNLNQEKRLDSNYEVAIFRLIQECTTNAIKHGQSTEIFVKLEWLKRSVNISVKDNGAGFDKELVKEQSFGIVGMKERIDILNGKMNIRSEIGKGTLVTFKIPFSDDEI